MGCRLRNVLCPFWKEALSLERVKIFILNIICMTIRRTQLSKAIIEGSYTRDDHYWEAATPEAKDLLQSLLCLD